MQKNARVVFVSCGDEQIGVFQVYDYLTERLVGIIWVTVLQSGFVYLKYMHNHIVLGDGKAGRLFASQLPVSALLFLFCFERELGIDLTSKALLIGGIDFHPWAARVAICGAAILLDALLALYIARIGLVCKYGLPSTATTMSVDLTVSTLAAALCGGYFYFKIMTASSLDIGMLPYLWVLRFFIPMSIFFHIGLGIGGVFMIWPVLRQVKKNEG
jgi:hypothetical protein